MTADIAPLAPERFTLWFNSAAEPVEKALAAMTAGEVIAALRWLESEVARTRRAAADDQALAEAVARGETPDVTDAELGAAIGRLEEAAAASSKAARFLELVRAAMPAWRKHPKLLLTQAVVRFWPR